MHRLVRSIRLAGILAAACLTLLSGLALVWFFVQPEFLPLLSTWQLAAILGSFVLPVLCLAAWQADRQAAAHAPRARAASPRAVKQVSTPSVVTIKVAPVALPAQSVQAEPVRVELQPAPLPTVGRLSPAGRSIRSDRAIHRHRRSARV
ncbi:MAG: hypothetical protein ACREJD_15850 [Phycisphaerales bacterium]